MARTQTVLQVFVASPGDVVDERGVLEEVIAEFNLVWGNENNLRLELVKWETHTRPGFGEDAQDVINTQIGDEYDIFLGIMWGRFGSPTDRADSGTEEEFDRAYSRFKSSPESVQIMFYFKDAGIAPSKMNPTQLAKVQEFRRKIESELGGLHHTFDSVEDFRTKSRIHLSKLVQDWLKGTRAPTGTGLIKPPETNVLHSAEPLANLMALTDDDYEDGVIDLSERANDAMAAVVGVMERITSATTELAENFEKRTEEVNGLVGGASRPDLKTAKRVANNAANDFEVYVQRLSVEIAEFHKQHTLAMDTFGKVAMISGADFEEDPQEVRRVIATIQGYREGISAASDSVLELRGSAAGLPRMTTAFNRARRRATATMDDLLAQFKTAGSQIQDVEQLLVRLIESTR